MATTLYLAATTVDEAALRRAVPPQVWPGHLAHLAWDDGRYTVALPGAALQDAREILPCLSAAACGSWGYQCALEYETASGQRGRAELDPIGAFDAAVSQMSVSPNVAAPPAAGPGAVEAAIDVLQIRASLQAATLHLRAQGIDAQAPALLSVSIRNRDAAPTPVADGPGAAIAVPPRSQMVLRPDLASHVCSPTSVAMLLDYYGLGADVYEIIAEARHQPSGLYGVWPANIHAAAQRGLPGYLLHFPAWDAARALLDAGLPIVASVRYEEGELNDAAIARTNGHLLVVRGYEGDKILVNDPAAKTDAEVARAYDLKEFCRVWLDRSAVGYVYLNDAF